MDQELLNDIISTSVGGAAGGAVAGLVLYGVQQAHQAIRDALDTKRVLGWMRAEAGGLPYRSTRAIASFNNLTEDRVRFVCSRCPEIVMSRGQKEDMWTVNKELEDFRDVHNQHQ
ncbi:hypothetical protein D3C75_250580 [compost metagenome]